MTAYQRDAAYREMVVSKRLVEQHSQRASSLERERTRLQSVIATLISSLKPSVEVLLAIEFCLKTRRQRTFKKF